MFDYRLIEALAAVWEEGGFERAAEKLFLTQSAVSQRIRALEEQAGQILISRSTPPVPTEKGKELIRLCRQVRLLEDGLGDRQGTSALPLGVNADSLATWFMEAVCPLLENGVTLDLKVDDQEKTREMLRNGEVAGCIGSDGRPLQGCGKHFLGKMAYVLAGTEAFCAKWFAGGMTREAVLEAPAVIFNRDDRLHDRFMESLFPSFRDTYPRHYVPSPEKFLYLIEKGRAYGAVPLLQAEPLLGRSLLELTDLRIEVDLWWHHWNLETDLLSDLTGLLTGQGRRLIY